MKFYLEDTVLAVCEDAYLVKVEVCGNNPPYHNHLTDLPDWVFHSRNAIWLTEEDAPISVRAQHGDLIRKNLMSHVDIS